MKTIEETYRERLAMLIAEYGGASELSKVIDKSPAQISQWLNGSPDSKTGKSRSFKSDTARDIEMKTGKPRAWFDQPVINFDVNQTSGAAFGDNANISGNHNDFSVSQFSEQAECKREFENHTHIMPDNSLLPVIPQKSKLWLSDDVAVKNGKIYLVEYGGVLWYRRLFQVPPNNQIMMKVFENKDFEEYIVPAEQLKIIGRVVKWTVEDE